MRILFVILVCCVYCSVTLILSTNAATSDELLPKQNVDDKNIETFVKSLDKKPNLILSQILKEDTKSFFGLILIPYIVCFFAAKGFWPFYPPILQYQVNEMGKKVFSLSDDRIRQFCRGKFNFQETCYRPVLYKGYFVPLPDAPVTECVTTVKSVDNGSQAGGTVTTTTTAPNPAGAQSWDTPARIQSNKNNVVDPVKSGTQSHKNPNEVEVFGTPTKLPQNSVEDLGEKQPPNINIEIHNIFSFGAEHPNNVSNNGTREV